MIEMTENPHLENYKTLGTLITRYAAITLTLAAIGFFFSFVASFEWLSSIQTAGTEAELIATLSSGIRTLLFGTAIFALIDYGVLIFLIIGINSLANYSWEFQDIMQKVRLFFVLSIGIGAVVMIFTFINVTKTLEDLLALIQNISTMTDQDMVEITNAVNNKSILLGILALIPTGLILAAYLKLAEVGSNLVVKFPNNPAALKIDKGFKFLKFGLLFGLISDLMSLIPNAPLVGLLSIVGVVLLYTGLFKAGGGLKEFSPIPFSNVAPMYPNDYYQSTTNLPSIAYSSPIAKNDIDLTDPTKTVNQSDMVVCPLCGFRELSSGAKFCSNCGNQF